MEVLLNSADPVIVFAFWLGVGVAALAVVMLMVIIVMRMVVLQRDRVHTAAAIFWRGILVHKPEDGRIPALRRRDLSGFVQVWNEVHDPLKGATTPYFARVAREVGLEAHLRRRLARAGFHGRLVALIAMGHVQNAASFDLVERFVDDRNPIVSLCAARALMQIDAPRAVSKFVPQIALRSDWSQGSVAAILTEAGADAVARELSEATLQANVEIAPRLIRFLAGVSPQAAGPIIRKALETAKDERLMSTCLQVMTNPGDLDVVRPMLAHPRWHVRMQAAVTLGRLGVAGDEQRLIGILTDQQWWVRYRAAQALLRMRTVGTENMRRIQAAQTDSYARDIIRQVLAEQAMGISTNPAVPQ